ncbi:MAG: DUF981 family protein [Candidatus Odinarchaeota archaeon]|nr:DUF981 family protein [Candidatus Odinarchaeota archaeon]
MINYITAMLLLLATASLAGFVYLFFRTRQTDEQAIQALDQNFGFLLMIVGLIATYLGIHMITTHPINVPNTPLYIYNMEFGIPYTFFGIIVLTTGYSLWKGLDLKPISYFAFFGGIFNLRYAWNFIEFGLTREPTMTFALYLAASLGAIVSPFFTHAKNESNKKIAVYIIMLFLLITGAVAGLIAFGAIESHVAEALAG